MECYCWNIQRRDYRIEVALSHLTAEAETYLCHRTTVIPQIWFIKTMKEENSCPLLQHERHSKKG